MSKNEVILYSYFRSSASFRVRMALAIKGIEYIYKAVHLLKDGGAQNTAAYREVNPMGHVPTLVIGDFVLPESMAIMDYLDNYSLAAPHLFPKNAKDRAKVFQICEVVNSGIQPLQNTKVVQHLGTLGLDKSQQTEWLKHWITPGLESLEKIVSPLAGTHTFGNSWTAADCFLIPQCFAANRFGIDLKKFPTLNRIYESLLNTDVVKKAHPANQPDSE